jgi:hypothetical protein
MKIEQLLTEQVDHALAKQLTAQVREMAAKMEFVISTDSGWPAVNRNEVLIGFSLYEKGGQSANLDDRLPYAIRVKGFLRLMEPLLGKLLDEGRSLSILVRSEKTKRIPVSSKADLRKALEEGVKSPSSGSFAKIGWAVGDTPEGIAAADAGGRTKIARVDITIGELSGKIELIGSAKTPSPERVWNSVQFFTVLPEKDPMVKAVRTTPDTSSVYTIFYDHQGKKPNETIARKLNVIAKKYGGPDLMADPEKQHKIFNFAVNTKVSPKGPRTAVELTPEQLKALLADLLKLKNEYF